MVGYDINADNKQKKLFYQTESRGWEEALPIGNGRIGAMVFGGSLNDRIQINEETLWSGCPPEEKREHSMEDVYKIRTMVKEDKYKEAHDATLESMLGVVSQVYQTCVTENCFLTVMDLYLVYQVRVSPLLQSLK